MATYIVQGRLLHDGKEYPHGSTFETNDERLAAELRQLNALKLPSELLKPDDIEAEIRRLREENEALKAAQSAQPASSDASDAGASPKSDGESSEAEQ